MLELVTGLRDRGLDVVVASPEGPLREHVEARGITHRLVPGTTASFKVSATGYARAAADIGRSAWAVRRLARELGADVVHANSIRSGLVAGLASRAGGPPAVVHARDTLDGGPVGAAVRTGLRTADLVIAISRHVERSLRLGRRPPVAVVHNPVDLARFDPAMADGSALRTELGGPLLGVIAQITPWKAQDDAIRALALLRERHPGAQLALVGETKFVGRDVTFDNVAFRRGLDELAAELGVSDAVHFLGEREDVPDILAALDLLLVPSWQEPFGRTVIEGMAMGRVVLATAAGGPREILEDGVDGRLLAPREPRAWADAAARLLDDRPEMERIGAAARDSARRFDRDRYAETIVALYRGLS
jgi:glycosyltransferase involved in cell wall biosynthesis